MTMRLAAPTRGLSSPRDDYIGDGNESTPTRAVFRTSLGVQPNRRRNALLCTTVRPNISRQAATRSCGRYDAVENRDTCRPPGEASFMTEICATYLSFPILCGEFAIVKDRAPLTKTFFSSRIH
jgi:hypothetical protein